MKKILQSNVIALCMVCTMLPMSIQKTKERGEQETRISSVPFEFQAFESTSWAQPVSQQASAQHVTTSVQTQVQQKTEAATQEKAPAKSGVSTTSAVSPTAISYHSPSDDSAGSDDSARHFTQVRIDDLSAHIETHRKQQEAVVQRIRSLNQADHGFSSYVQGELSPLLQEIAPLYKNHAENFQDFTDLLLLEHIFNKRKSENEERAHELVAGERVPSLPTDRNLEERLEYLRNEDRGIKIETGRRIIRELLAKGKNTFLHSPQAQAIVGYPASPQWHQLKPKVPFYQ